jgi:hypothetical protein
MGSDELILIAVLAVRLCVPLLIPRFPLPAILVCLVVDAADQSIFQNNTDLSLENYQGYDKALDIYYLSIAYLSTIRNWTDPFAARTAQFLWYYRLVGVFLFELTDTRALLMVFPNTFEYFFIAYEAVRLMWDPKRLSHRQVIGLAAFIWIFIKLPQEWWIHVAQLDFTDVMREDVLGVPLDTSWGDALSQNLWFVALLAIVAVALVVVGRRVARRLPPHDWPFSMDVDAHLDPTVSASAPTSGRSIAVWHVVEKIALVSLIVVIFVMVLPGSDLTLLGVAAPVAFVVVTNAVVSHWLAGRGVTWSSALTEMAAMTVLNGLAALVFIVVARSSESVVNEAALVFYLLLLTLIVTLFDRFTRMRGGIADDDNSLADGAISPG